MLVKTPDEEFDQSVIYEGEMVVDDAVSTPAESVGDVPALVEDSASAGQVDRGLRANNNGGAFSAQELDQLRAIGGLDEAPDGELLNLLAVARRTGLDPMLKQIYLVGRRVKDNSSYRGGKGEWVTRWSIQTGIEGFRAVTHRYAQSRGESVTIEEAVYYDFAGNQWPVWIRSDEPPAAATVTVHVGQSRATHTATWNEYCQTTRDGKPNSMWAKFGPTMLAKCAEAGAHRKICPLTAGMYETSEIPAGGSQGSVSRGVRETASVDQVREKLAVLAAVPQVKAAIEAADSVDALKSVWNQHEGFIRDRTDLLDLVRSRKAALESAGGEGEVG